MSCASVPRIVLTLNHASGAGYYAMAGQGFDPHFTFSWPTARIGVMEGESAVQAIYAPELEKLKSAGKPVPEELQGSIDQTRADYERWLDARYAAARGHVDAVIDPAQWGISVPVDSGGHLISVTAAGKRRWERSITIEKDGEPILTHCNSSAAFSIFETAIKQGKDINVIATETRPRQRGYVTIDFLQKAGIPPERMIASGRAEYDPVADNATDEGRRKNRRIEITLLNRELVQETTPAKQ